VRLVLDAPSPPSELGFAASGDGGQPLVARTTDPTRLLHDVTGWALRESVAIVDIEVARPSLEEVYLALTGRPQDEDASPGDGA
jgi:ABC-2 type transport system ATP-binding protein